MALSDGNDYSHVSDRTQLPLDRHHYDKIWEALKLTRVKMYGDHSSVVGTFTFVDVNQIRVGSVTFGAKGLFLGGEFYEFHVVSGRTLKPAAAFYSFMDRLAESTRRKGWQ